MKLIEIVLEIIGWLQIAIGVTLAAGLIAFYLKSNLGDTNLEEAWNNCMAFEN